jgi:hypothetical protein
MVNPRYRPTIANSRKPLGSKKEIGEIKVDLVFPPKEKYIGSHIKSKLGDEYASNESYEKYYKDLI